MTAFKHLWLKAKTLKQECDIQTGHEQDIKNYICMIVKFNNQFCVFRKTLKANLTATTKARHKH
jgi:hypothetical protein